VTVITTVLIVALVAYVAKTRSDIQSPERADLEDRDLVPNPAS
jgi:hypothetical protein